MISQAPCAAACSTGQSYHHYALDATAYGHDDPEPRPSGVSQPSITFIPQSDLPVVDLLQSLHYHAEQPAVQQHSQALLMTADPDRPDSPISKSLDVSSQSPSHHSI